MKPSSSSLRSDAAHVLRGLCMGAADIVPGVSGGTVALVLGIYERLVTAISHFDATLIGHLVHRRFAEAARHVDLRFLFSLGLGIGGGLAVMTVLMNYLLTDPLTRCLTLATFLGLIFGSALVVASLVRIDSKGHGSMCLLLGAVGGAFAFWLTTLGSGAYFEPSLAYLFLCGSVAICAMILPGISGAMILLIMGVYIHLTEIPKNLLAGRAIGSSLAAVAVFCAGATIGLVTFSKFLRWLLAKHHAYTMAVLCGFMFGALPKLWPFQRDLTPEIERIKHKQFESVLPTALDAQVVGVLIAFTVATAVVLVADRWSRQHQAQTTGS